MLGVFLESYGVKLTNDSLEFPANNVLGPQDQYVEGETKCDGKDAELSVRVWDSYTDTGAGNRYIANMDNIRIDHDGMVFGIYFSPKDAPETDAAVGPQPPRARCGRHEPAPSGRLPAVRHHAARRHHAGRRALPAGHVGHHHACRRDRAAPAARRATTLG